MQPDTACAKFLDELLARGQPSAALAAHLAACPDCRGLADTVHGLRRLPSVYPEGAFPALKAKVMAGSIPAAAAAGAGAGAAAGGSALLKTAAAILVPLAVVAGLAVVSLRQPEAPPARPAPTQVAAPAIDHARPATPATAVATPAAAAGKPADPADALLPADQE